MAMNEDLGTALSASDELRSTFETIWKEITGSEPGNYELYIWGSTIDPKTTANDLDIIYELREMSISDKQHTSLKGWLRSELHVDGFESVDPMIATSSELYQTLSNSRAEEIYSVDRHKLIDRHQLAENRNI